MTTSSERFNNIKALNKEILSKQSFTMKEAKEIFDLYLPDTDDKMIVEYLSSYGRKIIDNIILDTRPNTRDIGNQHSEEPKTDESKSFDEMSMDELLEWDLSINGDSFKGDFESESEFEDNHHLLKAFHESNNMEVLGELLRLNTPMVKKIASRYQHYLNHKLDFDDLVNIGYTGLMKAVYKFNRDFGSKISTYAYYWIKQSITRALIDEGFTIRIPVHVFEKVSKITQMEKQMDMIQNDINVEAICMELQITPEKYRFYKVIQSQIIDLASLNMKVNNESNEEIGEFVDPNETTFFLSQDQFIDPELEVLKNDLKITIELLLGELTQREAEIIKLRFGLMDDKERTLEEVGKFFGVTRERIRQIEAKALAKLKNKKRILDGYLI